jgi:hypothetical protein
MVFGVSVYFIGLDAWMSGNADGRTMVIPGTDAFVRFASE